MSALQSGEAEEVPESTSADGKVISFRQLTKDANLWLLDSGVAQQLTLDSLSDYSPVLSGDGRTLAFQRSQPAPSRGYTILDAKVFVSPFEGGAVTDPQSVADGFAPDLSSDGRWLAFLQMNDQPGRMTLSVRDLRSGGTILVSQTTEMPSLSLTPVDWAARITAWSRSGDELYFVDQAEGFAIRRYSAGTPGPGRQVWKAGTDLRVRDLYISPSTGRLGFLSWSRDGDFVHELDPAANTVRTLAQIPRIQRGVGIVGRGWLDSQFLLLRSVQMHRDRSADLEVLLTDGGGGTKIVGRITNGFSSTARLHASRRTIYLTRTDKGVHNVYAFSLDTGSLTAATQNSLPGVTFSGFQPMGARGTLAAREERRADIWIIQQTATPRSGNPAGR